MGFILVGKNGGRIDLGVDHGIAIYAVLSELLGKDIDVGLASEDECRAWAAILRKNLQRLRVIKGNYNDFLVIQGINLERMFAGARYRHSIVGFKPSWEGAQELSPDWKEFVNDVIAFFDSCGGIERVTGTVAIPEPSESDEEGESETS